MSTETVAKQSEDDTRALEECIALSELPVGASAVVASLDLPGEVGDHLMHLGFLPEATIAVLRRAPAGDPTVYRIEGAEIALRRETACHIHVHAQPVTP
jgi:ferrous iron transport protein A